MNKLMKQIEDRDAAKGALLQVRPRWVSNGDVFDHSEIVPHPSLASKVTSADQKVEVWLVKFRLTKDQ